MIQAILGLISIPVMLLNFGWIVGGIWLVILGEWGLLGLGLASMFISSFGLGFVLMPGFLLALPGTLALDRGEHVIGGLCVLASNLWTLVVITVWCVGCFYVVLRYYNAGSIWPYLLWAYGMATGPWSYMAARGGSNETGSLLSAFGACVGAIAIMGVLLFADDPSILDCTIAFSIPMTAVLLFQIVIAFMLLRDKRLRAM